MLWTAIASKHEDISKDTTFSKNGCIISGNCLPFFLYPKSLACCSVLSSCPENVLLLKRASLNDCSIKCIYFVETLKFSLQFWSNLKNKTTIGPDTNGQREMITLLEIIKTYRFYKIVRKKEKQLTKNDCRRKHRTSKTEWKIDTRKLNNQYINVFIHVYIHRCMYFADTSIFWYI